MFRTPFVWEVQVRREVLEDEIARLRQVPHSLWRDLVGRPMAKRTKGRDNRPYRVRTLAGWVGDGTQDIRVSVALESPTFRRRLMRQSFVISPENTFKDR